MLTIKCSACKQKLWKYDKIGPGSVLRCHKSRITRFFQTPVQVENKIRCSCGKEIGIDKGSFYKMIANAVTHTGTKRNS